jgi:hypothetical protein
MKSDRCQVDGCELPPAYAGIRHGKKRYKCFCNKHDGERRKLKKELSDEPCQVCGWKQSYCDTHRVRFGKNGGRYVRENVLVVCPNHHRLIHDKKLFVRETWEANCPSLFPDKDPQLTFIFTEAI